MLSRASWRMRLTAADPGRTDIGGRGPSSAISTHPLSILPARGRGGSCPEVSTRDPRGVLPGAGEGASGSSNLRVEASGHESSYGVLLWAFRHMIGAAVSSSSAKADSFAAE
jgi:hypothetical protein